MESSLSILPSRVTKRNKTETHNRKCSVLCLVDCTQITLNFRFPRWKKLDEKEEAKQKIKLSLSLATCRLV